MQGQPYAALTPPQTSGLAITSLVCGVLGIITCGMLAVLTFLPAIICGHMALSQIGKSAGRIKGSGLAIAGLVTGYVQSLFAVMVIVSILAGVALPVFGAVKEKALLTKALSNAKQVGAACKIYALEHDGKFPAKLEDLVPEIIPDASVLLCPYPDPKNPVPFEYFGGSENDGPQKVLLASPAVEGKGRVFIYVDGSGKVKTRQQLKRAD